MRKKFIRIGSLAAFAAVILGAFAAHGLKAHLTPDDLITFQTGVRYHFYHAFAILIVGILLYNRKTNLLRISGWLFLTGILFFSGSLYLLAVRETMNLGLNWLGPITPIGGLFFIGGWVCLFLSTYQDNQRGKK